MPGVKWKTQPKRHETNNKKHMRRLLTIITYLVFDVTLQSYVIDMTLCIFDFSQSNLGKVIGAAWQHTW
jgi:hypothetical protein